MAVIQLKEHLGATTWTRVLVARFAGSCSSCHTPIAPGDFILWSTSGQIRHFTCPTRT